MQPPAPSPSSVSLLGTGLLGAAIGQRLLERGHPLTVWNRTALRCAPLVAAGAHQAASAAAAISAAEVVITVLSNGPATAAVLLEAGGAGLAGRRVMQMATIAPKESRELAAAVAARGGHYIEAPVLGSRPEALAGSLQLMAGGSRADVEPLWPLLEDLATAPVHLGEVGSAMATKLALNQLIASLTHAFSLSLHLVQHAGVEVEAFMQLLRGSALYAPTFDKKLARELAGDYAEPNFPTAHLRKDLALFLAAARGAGLAVEGLEGLAALLERATPAGLDSLDYCALHALTAGPSAAAAPG